MNKKVIFRGASAIMPLCIGDFPFSFIVGALSVSAGMSVLQSTAWSAIVIAGSAQMLALNMLKTGATLGVIIFTTLIINLRHVLYSASISGTVREASFFKKCFMSYALTDEVYATTVKEMEGNKKEKYLFYGSAMITFWAMKLPDSRSGRSLKLRCLSKTWRILPPSMPPTRPSLSNTRRPFRRAPVWR